MIKFKIDPEKVAEFVLWMEENRQKLLDSIPPARCILLYKDAGELRESIRTDSLKNKTDRTDKTDGGKDG